MIIDGNLRLVPKLFDSSQRHEATSDPLALGRTSSSLNSVVNFKEWFTAL